MVFVAEELKEARRAYVALPGYLRGNMDAVMVPMLRALDGLAVAVEKIKNPATPGGVKNDDDK